jgi:CBS domain-containing protein
MIEDTASVLDAAIEMGKRHFRHLLVRNPEGPVVGMVSERDLFRVQQQGIAQLHAPIDEARSVEEIVHLAARLREFTQRVFRQGMAVTQFTRLVSSINDRLTRRLLDLIVGDRHPDWHFCWLSFGSEGREEQGFVTDQDNGIVFVPPAPTNTEALRAEYLEMAHVMNEALHAAGFERCKGNIMAGNPEWCLSLPEWQRKFSSWVHGTTPTAILNSTIFFDFRPIYGDFALAEQMRDHLLEEIRGNTIFLHRLAANALEVSVPVGTMNRFKTDGGEHKGTLDLKTQGTRLFVDIARIYALANSVRAANTAQRLETVGKRIKRSANAIGGDIAALRFITGLRLRRQLDSLEDGKDANRLDPYALNDLDQRMLRDSLRQAQSLQERLKLDYQR